MQSTCVGRDGAEWSATESLESLTGSKGGAGWIVARPGCRELELELEAESERPTVIERIRDLSEVR